MWSAEKLTELEVDVFHCHSKIRVSTCFSIVNPLGPFISMLKQQSEFMDSFGYRLTSRAYVRHGK